MTVLGTLGRMILVPIALIVAAIAASIVLLTLGLETFTQEMARDSYDTETYVIVRGLIAQGAVLASAVSIVPTLLVVLIGEIGRIRSLLFYMAGGGLAVAAAPLIAGMAAGDAIAMPQGAVLQVAATAGFFGGFVYWLLAGRTA
ncbi:MAG: hypothetical protein AAFR23_00140 [Pseudomonadota bacterium]